jgi:ribosomal protein L16 Arg81 hydroxylase
LLNFGRLFTPPSSTSPDQGVSKREQDWLEKASHAKAVEAILKQGEVLFIPSHWFHYIVGLQKMHNVMFGWVSM